MSTCEAPLKLDAPILIPWLTFILWWAIAATRVKPDLHRGWRQHVTGIRLALLVVFIILLRHTPVSAWMARHLTLPLTPWTRALALSGVLLCWAGIAFAIWARLHLGANWSARPSLKENHELVTTGPYRWLRHPIYSGLLIALLGSALDRAGAWLVLLPVVLLIFIRRVVVEERLMLRIFPDRYPAYQARTSALIPFIF